MSRRTALTRRSLVGGLAGAAVTFRRGGADRVSGVRADPAGGGVVVTDPHPRFART